MPPVTTTTTRNRPRRSSPFYRGDRPPTRRQLTEVPDSQQDAAVTDSQVDIEIDIEIDTQLKAKVDDMNDVVTDGEGTDGGTNASTQASTPPPDTAVDRELRVRGEPLPPPPATVTTMTVWQLNQLEDREQLLSATLAHRGGAWPLERQSRYIRELFHNVASSCFTFAEGEVLGEREPMLVDGYQRLNAIVNFYTEQVPYMDEYGPVWYLHASETWRQTFDATRVIVRRFATMPDRQPAVWRILYRPAF